jgi:tetratricopeptide (TPR) repeat protein
MGHDRVEQLQSFIRANPRDPFPRYALALEHKNSGRLDEASQVFAELMTELPDYVPAYLHAGNTLVARGLRAEAKDVYVRGIEQATAKRDFHAKSELEGALADLE